MAAARPEPALTLGADPAPLAIEDYVAVRAQTAALCAPLELEDYGPQSMPEASPAKWHLAHTSWFFERFVLQPQLPGYECFHPQFERLFNSYYESVGPRQPRPSRGLLSRPTVAEVYRYRAHVDRHVERLLAAAPAAPVLQTLTVGLHHEQQHQELLLTDLKHLLFANPLRPSYRGEAAPPPRGAPATGATADTPRRWRRFDGGEQLLGADPQAGFCFDNESPRHRCYTGACALAERPVTNAEFRDFIRAGGYRTATLWLSDGWQQVQSQGWDRPLYWSETLESEFTLHGEAPLAPAAPVCHVSYYEAEAFARWSGARLPTEAEWERAAAHAPVEGNLLESEALHPRASALAGGLKQLYGDVWEWTGSAYLPYPGYRPWPDALGEYNGKFMANQFVLRGGSCATPRSHLRASYRNFFYPAARWQFSGIRLAQDA
jgi:ergothioneine biosynthesis protein EgtB